MARNVSIINTFKLSSGMASENTLYHILFIIAYLIKTGMGYVNLIAKIKEMDCCHCAILFKLQKDRNKTWASPFLPH